MANQDTLSLKFQSKEVSFTWTSHTSTLTGTGTSITGTPLTATFSTKAQHAIPRGQSGTFKIVVVGGTVQIHVEPNESKVSASAAFQVEQGGSGTWSGTWTSA